MTQTHHFPPYDEEVLRFWAVHAHQQQEAQEAIRSYLCDSTSPASSGSDSHV